MKEENERTIFWGRLNSKIYSHQKVENLHHIKQCGTVTEAAWYMTKMQDHQNIFK